MVQKKRMPVIIDTDIGGDIDDTWALAFALLRDELDIRLVTTVLGDPEYRAKIIAKMNECCGKGNIDIGLCRKGWRESVKYQEDWVSDYNLSEYSGHVYEDGIDRMIDIVKSSSEKITIIALGPCTNLAEAVKRYPEMGKKVRVVGVFGAIRTGYFGGEVCPECNVESDIESARVFLSEYNDILITPIDTCFDAVLDKERYSRLEKCRMNNSAVQALLENFEIWGSRHPRWKNEKFAYTSELCDTVAVYLAMTSKGLNIENLNLEIADDGKTLISDTGSKVAAAMEWNDLEYFLNYLTDTYCNFRK